MLRCALLLSLVTIRSVVGHPGVFPFKPGATNGSAAVEICAARHKCVDDVGFKVQEAGAILDVSPAAKDTVVLATSWYGLPVPNSATRKSTLTVSEEAESFRDTLAKAKFVALFCGSSFCG